MICDISAWGLTAVDAYLAYNDPTMLTFAKAMWDQTSYYQLTDKDIQNEFSTVQNAQIPASCHGGEWRVRQKISFMLSLPDMTQ